MQQPARLDTLHVPFVDLEQVNGALADEIGTAVAKFIRDGAFVNGPQVREFEDAFARYCGARACVGVGSGHDALRLALEAFGIEAGDEVIVPANTFVSTFGAIVQAGGRPVAVDVSEVDRNIDVDAFAAALTPRTRFVVPVHLYGQLADMRGVRRIADRAGISVLEDACQAHGARRDGLRPGEAGRAAAFSFYPAKNLGAAGDAGAVVTNDGSLTATIRALREHGQTQKNLYARMGYTARLDTLQALILLRKLPHLDTWNAQRRAAAGWYAERLADCDGIRLPQVVPGSEHVWHVYAVRTAEPSTLAEWLEECGISTGRHYPTPAHLSPAYAWLGHSEGEFPVAETLARELLSLPMFPGITEEQVEHVASSIHAFFARG